jgi:holo-[acyl-carrier protein] synthase
MIRGVGVDIVDIGRIERLIERYGDVFLKRVFTQGERAYCSAMARPAVHFAARFAVKEAFYKALPADVQPHSGWRSIETVSSERGGQPRIGVVDDTLSASLDSTGLTRMHVSISHEQKVCVAMVVLEQP